MTNSAFHKLCYEFDLNYKYQPGFMEHCIYSDIMYVGFYGTMEASTADKKAAREYWKKAHKVWFKDLDEVDAYIDAMPIGGYKSDADALAVLKNHRKKL